MTGGFVSEDDESQLHVQRKLDHCFDERAAQTDVAYAARAADPGARRQLYPPLAACSLAPTVFEMILLLLHLDAMEIRIR